jgi:hypothetical protein
VHRAEVVVLTTQCYYCYTLVLAVTLSTAVSVPVHTASSQDSTGFPSTGTELTDTRVFRSAVQATAAAS